MVQSAVTSARMFDFDSVVVPFDMTVESQALGNEISLYEDSEDILYPTIPEKRWKSLEDIDIPDNILELGRMPMLLEAIALAKKEAPEHHHLPAGKTAGVAAGRPSVRHFRPKENIAAQLRQFLRSVRPVYPDCAEKPANQPAGGRRTSEMRPTSNSEKPPPGWMIWPTSYRPGCRCR
jgi:hypothetical protein